MNRSLRIPAAIGFLSASTSLLALPVAAQEIGAHPYFEAGLQDCVAAVMAPETSTFESAESTQGDVNSGLVGAYGENSKVPEFAVRLTHQKAKGVAGFVAVCEGTPSLGPMLAQYIQYHDENIREFAKVKGLVELDAGPVVHFAACDDGVPPVMFSILALQTHQIGFQVLLDERVPQMCAKFPRKEKN